VKSISLNINGDLPSKELIERVKIAEDAGIKEIWLGELELFRDPVKVAEEITSETNSELYILLSPARRSCSEIIKIAKRYKVGLILGKSRELNLFITCLEKVKKQADEVYAGVSGPKITEEASKHADGLLLNYVHPEYIDWIKRFMVRAVPTYSFGPSLILPSRFYEDLLIAASIVMRSNEEFLRTFNLYDVVEDLPSEYSNLIGLRQEGKTVKGLREFQLIEKNSEILLDNFTISGNFKEVSKKIDNILMVCDCVVLGDPFFRDIESVKSLRELVDFNGD
jgi:5,10-methylenetetrahydromethanopterin reductase